MNADYTVFYAAIGIIALLALMAAFLMRLKCSVDGASFRIKCLADRIEGINEHLKCEMALLKERLNSKSNT